MLQPDEVSFGLNYMIVLVRKWTRDKGEKLRFDLV